jgi:hypothetical protein
MITGTLRYIQEEKKKERGKIVFVLFHLDPSSRKLLYSFVQFANSKTFNDFTLIKNLKSFMFSFIYWKILSNI